MGHEPRPYNDCCPRLDFPVLQLDAGEAISLDDQMCDGRVDDADTAGGELFALLAGQCVTLSEEGDVDGPSPDDLWTGHGRRGRGAAGQRSLLFPDTARSNALVAERVGGQAAAGGGATAPSLGMVGPRLRGVREGRGLTLTRAAEQTGISKSPLSWLENGQRRPTLDLLLLTGSRSTMWLEPHRSVCRRGTSSARPPPPRGCTPTRITSERRNR